MSPDLIICYPRVPVEDGIKQVISHYRTPQTDDRGIGCGRGECSNFKARGTLSERGGVSRMPRLTRGALGVEVLASVHRGLHERVQQDAVVGLCGWQQECTA